jgi:hypothetical protein
MAANYIELDRTTDVGRNLIRGLQMLREAKDVLVNVRDVMLQMRDGDGTQASHYDVLRTEAGYIQNDYATPDAAAKASFDELDSLLSKINTDNSVSNVLAAINQACAKHGA